MKISEAMSKKIMNLCNERKMSVNQFSNNCLLTQSTVQNIVECNSKNPKLLTIIRICDGLNISLKEFFDDELFNNLDREE